VPTGDGNTYLCPNKCNSKQACQNNKCVDGERLLPGDGFVAGRDSAARRSNAPRVPRALSRAYPKYGTQQLATKPREIPAYHRRLTTPVPLPFWQSPASGKLHVPGPRSVARTSTTAARPLRAAPARRGASATGTTPASTGPPPARPRRAARPAASAAFTWTAGECSFPWWAPSLRAALLSRALTPPARAPRIPLAAPPSGSIISCGSLGGECPNGATCSSDGTACVTPPPTCERKTQCSPGKKCGTEDDGCGGELQCGLCPAGQSCTVDGLQCVSQCVPRTTCDEGRGCGTQVGAAWGAAGVPPW
jgi:hypothetical protein